MSERQQGVTVVLGWDALDFDLVRRFGLEGAFGPATRRIDTIANPDLGEPHTRELWPTIISGLPPDEHGIHAVSDAGPDWKNPAIAAASRLARGIVPVRLRTMIGRVLRNRGAQFSQKTPAYYRERGVETVFDGRASRAIAIPNYRVATDEPADYVIDRGAQLASFFTIQEGTNRPASDLGRVDERLVAETGKKIGAVRAALRREYDLVFVWLGYLDTVGHLAPVVAEQEPGWQERAYHLAAAITDEVRSELTDEDTLLCISDHGLQDGNHTHDAYVGASDKVAVNDLDSVLDIAAAIDRVTPASGTSDDPGVREPYRYEARTEARGPTEVRNQLEDLGYL